MELKPTKKCSLFWFSTKGHSCLLPLTSAAAAWNFPDLETVQKLLEIILDGEISFFFDGNIYYIDRIFPHPKPLKKFKHIFPGGPDYEGTSVPP